MIAEREPEIAVSGALSGMLAPEAVSDEIVRMVEGVQQSVVQVAKHGRGGGAGVIWRDDGAVLTNFHVIAGSPGALHVKLADGRELAAEVVNYNQTLDLALLKVDAHDLPAAPVADSSKLRVGELVFAVGHPWGQPGVVTAGIVSGVGSVPMPRTNREAEYIRSDVRVAPGNSGGPMLNAQGAVVGITAMIFGGDLAVGIPAHVAAEWVAGIPSRRVYLGVGVQPVVLPAEQRPALMIVALEPDGPAHKAGVMLGDVVLAVGGKPVDEPDDLRDTIARHASADRVHLRVLRAGVPTDIDVQLDTGELTL